MAEKANVFISYARADGSEQSKRLFDALTADGITAWRDQRINPYAGMDAEIETALDAATYVAVIITPDVKKAAQLLRQLSDRVERVYSDAHHQLQRKARSHRLMNCSRPPG